MNRRRFSWVAVILITVAVVVSPLVGPNYAHAGDSSTGDVHKKIKSFWLGKLCDSLAVVGAPLLRPPKQREACREWDQGITRCGLGALCGYTTGGPAGMTGAYLSCLCSQLESLGLGCSAPSQWDAESAQEVLDKFWGYFDGHLARCLESMVPNQGLDDVKNSNFWAPCSLGHFASLEYCERAASLYGTPCGCTPLSCATCRCRKGRNGYWDENCQAAVDRCMGKHRAECGNDGWLQGCDLSPAGRQGQRCNWENAVQ